MASLVDVAKSWPHGRNVALQRGHDRAQPRGMIGGRPGELVAGSIAPVSRHLLGEGGSLGEAAPEVDDLGPNVIDLVAKCIDVMHRENNRTAGDGKDRQARQIAQPNGIDEGRTI